MHDARSTSRRRELIIHIRTTEENVFIHSFTYCSRFPVKHCNEATVGNYGETYCFRLLNANEISCIRTDLFKDLTSLTLLSLYDNNIRSLANGTFANLRSIKTLFVLLIKILTFLNLDECIKKFVKCYWKCYWNK